MSKIILEDSTMTNIADAIRNKNGETGQYLPSEMPSKIEAIETGGSGLIKINNNFSYLDSIDVSKFEETVEKGEYINGMNMFYSKKSIKFQDIVNIPLKFINLEYAFCEAGGNPNNIPKNIWDLSKCISLSYAFLSSIIGSINITNWDTSNVLDFNYMFRDCRATTIDGLEGLDTSNALFLKGMFYGSYCSQNIILNWNVKNVRSTSYMFNDSRFKGIDMSSLNFKNLKENPDFRFNKNYVRNIVLPNMPSITETGNLYICNSPNSSNYDIHCTFGEGNTWGNEVDNISVTLNFIYLWRTADFVDNYVEFAESIAPNTSGWSRNIKFYTTLYNALTEEQIAILTDKGYTVSYGTS